LLSSVFSKAKLLAVVWMILPFTPLCGLILVLKLGFYPFLLNSYIIALSTDLWLSLQALIPAAWSLMPALLLVT
jgi:hypothetical protein